MNHVSLRIASILFPIALLWAAPRVIAAVPTDGEVQRFLAAYPAAELAEAGWKAGARRLAAQDSAIAARADCLSDGFDRAVVDQAIREIVKDYFHDSEVLEALTRTLETATGRKMIDAILRQGPKLVAETGRLDGATLATRIQFTEEERAELLAFRASPYYQPFADFGKLLGPRLEQAPSFSRMFSQVRTACLK